MARRGLSFRVTGTSNLHDRAVAGSMALHSQYSKGNETSAQLAAQTRNLEIANHDRMGSVTNINTVTKAERIHHGAIRLPKTGHYITARSRGRRYGIRFQDGAYLAGLRPLPRSDRFIAYDAKKAPRPVRATGIYRKFIKELGVGNFSRRTSWIAAHESTGFVRIVRPRKKRLAHQKNWIHRGHIWIPK